MSHINDCWAIGAWTHGSWVEGSWCPEVCDPAPIGSSWAIGAWSNTSWCENTWSDAGEVCTADIIGDVWNTSSWEIVWCLATWANRSTPVPPAPEPVRAVEQRRWPGPSIVIYDELDQLKKIKRKYREEEEVIIL